MSLILRIESHESGLVRAFYIVGLCLLPLAFWCSLISGVGTIGEEYRTVGILKANPASVGQWTFPVVVLGILPIAVGLAFVILHFLFRNRTKTEPNTIQFIVGCLLTVFGTYYFLAVFSSYGEAVHFAGQWNATYIADSLRSIYVGYGFSSVLWLVTGIFFLVTACLGGFRRAEG